MLYSEHQSLFGGSTRNPTDTDAGVILDSSTFTSTCGAFDCGTCKHRDKLRCPGCIDGNKALIADDGQACAIYLCADSRGLTACSDCNEAVCDIPKSLEGTCPVRAQFEKKRCYTRKLLGHYTERRSAKALPHDGPKIPEKCITRLPSYLFALDDYLAQGIARVSSEDISRKVGIKDYLIRHDLNFFGDFGRPSLGYDAQKLRDFLADTLRLNDDKRVVWVGASRLGAEPSIRARFDAHGFHIVAVFDPDAEISPTGRGDLEVRPFDDLARTVSEMGVGGAILAVSESVAQDVTNRLVGAGIVGILNLTSSAVDVPPTVCVRQVDVVAELLTLSYYCSSLHKRK